MNTRGSLLVCIETEAHLRRQGLPTGIDGPSYECSKASTPTEFAMFADEKLWAKDRAMNSIYFWIRDNIEPSTRKGILAAQRAWLAERNSCGGDASCLHDVYDRRLRMFKDIDVSS